MACLKEGFLMSNIGLFVIKLIDFRFGCLAAMSGFVFLSQGVCEFVLVGVSNE